MTGAHDELPPARLLDDETSPAALRAALHALRERAPSDASAARIRERIQSPPPLAPGDGRVAGASIVVLGLLGLMAFSLWPQRTAPTAAPAPAPLPVAQAPEPSLEGRPSTTSASSPSSAPARLTAPVAAALERERQPKAPAPVPLVAPEPPRSERRVRLNPRAAVAAPVGTAPRERSALVPEPAPSTALAAQRPVQPAPEATDVQPLPKPAAVEDAERMFADPQDEAGLLYRAKRLSSSEPKAALRLLVLHEASFPAGAFAQERDMLEIQIHERLGHAATAKRLAASFKQRYPSSVYGVSP
jgi:hypothetical protein